MGTTYSVEQGDSLPTIAAKFGFRDWRTIYDDAHNADFRNKRTNPNILSPGDELYIPDKVQKVENISTGNVQHIEIKRGKILISIIVKDIEEQPLANKDYELVCKSVTYQGVTNADGLVEQVIDGDVKEGTLTVWDAGQGSAILVLNKLKIGHLDPVEEFSGVCARLENLGYDVGTPSDENDPQFSAAVEEFQYYNGLPVTGTIDPDTRATIVAVYGC